MPMFFFWGAFLLINLGEKIKMGIKKKSIQVPILFLFSCDLIVCNIEHLESNVISPNSKSLK